MLKLLIQFLVGGCGVKVFTYFEKGSKLLVLSLQLSE